MLDLHRLTWIQTFSIRWVKMSTYALNYHPTSHNLILLVSKVPAMHVGLEFEWVMPSCFQGRQTCTGITFTPVWIVIRTSSAYTSATEDKLTAHIWMTGFGCTGLQSYCLNQYFWDCGMLDACKLQQWTVWLWLPLIASRKTRLQQDC